MRAKEIAEFKLEMRTDVEDELTDVIALINETAKARRLALAAPIAMDLKVDLVVLKVEAVKDYHKSSYVATSKRSNNTFFQAIVYKLADWYRAIGFMGAFSRNARKSALTK